MVESTIERELSEGGVYATCAIGNSMRPMLRDGRDMVIIEPPKRELRRLDVVLYRNTGGAYVLHRIISVRDNEYIIRGDNTYTNEHVPKDSILGVLVAYNKRGKRHECTDLSYRFYSWMRVFSYPLRRVFLFALGLPRRMFRKIFKKRSK